jgi:hypothetical protein
VYPLYLWSIATLVCSERFAMPDSYVKDCAVYD